MECHSYAVFTHISSWYIKFLNSALWKHSLHTHTITHIQTHTHRIDGGFTYHWRVTKVCNDYGLLSTEILEKDKEKNI